MRGQAQVFTMAGLGVHVRRNMQFGGDKHRRLRVMMKTHWNDLVASVDDGQPLSKPIRLQEYNTASVIA